MTAQSTLPLSTSIPLPVSHSTIVNRIVVDIKLANAQEAHNGAGPYEAVPKHGCSLPSHSQDTQPLSFNSHTFPAAPPPPPAHTTTPKKNQKEKERTQRGKQGSKLASGCKRKSIPEVLEGKGTKNHNSHNHFGLLFF